MAGIVDKLRHLAGAITDRRGGSRKSDADEEGRPGLTADRALIVGLGNPGRKYRGNRHNIGFLAVERLAERHGLSFGKAQHKAIVAVDQIAGRPVILAKPQTYMNLSGEAVGRLVRYYRIPPESVLVVYDEIDLPFGTLRLREKGGAGGHNGMRSIIEHLGQEFSRLRLGVGRPPGSMDPADFVLKDFDQDQLPLLDRLLDEAIAAVETYLREGIVLAISRHNGPIEAS